MEGQNYYENVGFLENRLPVRVWNHDLKGETVYTQLHWHRSLELTLNIKGKARFNINGQIFFLQEGEWCIINGGEVHSVDGCNKDDFFQAVTVIISWDFIKQWSGADDDVWFEKPEDDNIREKIIHILVELSKLNQEKGSYTQVMMMAKGSELLYYLLNNCMVKKDKKERNIKEREFSKIKPALEIIEEKYKDTLSLESVAEEVQLSSGYFSRLFKKKTGYNFYSYIQKVRLYHAIFDLKKSELTILDCALNNGFPNVKSFIDIVKKEYGCTPNEYRKNWKARGGVKNQN